MAYELNDIDLGQEIICHLLEQHELQADAEPRLYKAYTESERVQSIVKLFGDHAEADVDCYGNTVYLIPRAGNRTLGFSRAQLKRALCGANATDQDYHLAQFAIITLLVEFYDGQGSSSKTRDYIRFGDLQNSIAGWLALGAKRYNESEQDMYGAAYAEMSQRYEALRSEIGSRSRSTKEGFLYSILRFLREQGLVEYIEKDEMIMTTAKLDRFVDYNLLNNDNYSRWASIVKDTAHEHN